MSFRQFGSQPLKLKFGNDIFRPLYWAFRRFQFWLCFYQDDVEIDIDDLTNPFNTQPPSLDDLHKLTGFKRDWIMFLYRNFKQCCSNGRMSQTQWRQIFRLIFKGAADYDFADRIFLAIAGNRSQKLITFEDLILCLYDLVQSFRNMQSLDTIENSVPSTTTAEFAFSLMLPDKQGRIDESAFVKYVRSVFDLNSGARGMSCSSDAVTFGMMSQHTNSYHGSLQTDKSGSGRRETKAPWIESLARHQFKTLDADSKGYITLSDIQSLFDQRCAYESLILQMESEVDANVAANEKMPNTSS
jgi:Ca2+-binding EF-hand superfamily protein